MSISEIYQKVYVDFKQYTEGFSESVKEELLKFLYPLFCILASDLLRKGQRDKAVSAEAETFIRNFSPTLNNSERNLFYHFKERMMEMFSCDLKFKYQIAISAMTQNYLTFYFQKPENEVLEGIVRKFIKVQVYEGPIRSVKQTRALCGSIMGEALLADNETAVYYATNVNEFFREVQLEAQVLSDSPSANRVPVPPFSVKEEHERIKARSIVERCSLELPSSAIMFTINNAHFSVFCADFSENGKTLALGFSDGTIMVYALTHGKLIAMKNIQQLQSIDKSQKLSHDMLMDQNNVEDSRKLVGHSECVNSVKFANLRPFLLSSSMDKSIRLWSTLTWTCLVAFEGHISCIWHSSFAPNDYYFASASEDKTAQIWKTDAPRSLRILIGHNAGVNCVIFHPNSNYVATSCDDCTVRMWDVLSGNQVRLLTGHKSSVAPLAFSRCGRYLISGDRTQTICVWDVSKAVLIAQMNLNVGVVGSISVCRTGRFLGISGISNQIIFISLFKLIEDYIGNSETKLHDLPFEEVDNYVVSIFKCNANPVLALYYTRDNIPVAIEAAECKGCSECC